MISRCNEIDELQEALQEAASRYHNNYRRMATHLVDFKKIGTKNRFCIEKKHGTPYVSPVNYITREDIKEVSDKEKYKSNNMDKLLRFYNHAVKTHIDGLDCWDTRVQTNELHIYCDDIKPMSNRFVPGSKVLVLGCSIGYQVYALKRLGFVAKGCDISEWAIERAITGDCICCNITDMPYEDEEFDVVLGTDIMEHIPIEWLDDALKEIKRVTKNKFLSRTPFDWQEPHWQFELGKVFSEHMINEDETFWSPRILKFFTGWKETIWFQEEEPKFWRYYLYEKEEEKSAKN